MVILANDKYYTEFFNQRDEYGRILMLKMSLKNITKIKEIKKPSSISTGNTEQNIFEDILENFTVYHRLGNPVHRY